MSERETPCPDRLCTLRARLESEKLTCILQKGDNVLTSTQTGIRPLLEWIDEKQDTRDGAAADKIVGKAAALLYVFMGVRAVYAEVLSAGGLRTLQAHGIRAEYGTLTDYIVNRAGTGMCPMEETVQTVSDPAEALAALRATAARLRAASAQKTATDTSAFST